MSTLEKIPVGTKVVAPVYGPGTIVRAANSESAQDLYFIDRYGAGCWVKFGEPEKMKIGQREFMAKNERYCAYAELTLVGEPVLCRLKVDGIGEHGEKVAPDYYLGTLRSDQIGDILGATMRAFPDTPLDVTVEPVAGGS